MNIDKIVWPKENVNFFDNHVLKTATFNIADNIHTDWMLASGYYLSKVLFLIISSKLQFYSSLPMHAKIFTLVWFYLFGLLLNQLCDVEII